MMDVGEGKKKSREGKKRWKIGGKVQGRRVEGRRVEGARWNGGKVPGRGRGRCIHPHVRWFGFIEWWW
jgi:hypothetical protein